MSAPSPFQAAARTRGAPLAERRPITARHQLIDSLNSLQETLGAFAQAVDAMASASGSPGAGPQHRLKNMSESEADAYYRGYRAGYTRAWRKAKAYDGGE